MPLSTPRLPFNYDGQDHARAFAFISWHAIQLHTQIRGDRSYPENYFWPHFSGVTNWQALMVLVSYAKAYHSAARLTYPEGQGSLEDVTLSRKWRRLNDLCTILEQCAPRKAATILVHIEGETDIESIRQCLEERGMHVRVLVHGKDDEESGQAIGSGFSMDEETLVSEEGAIVAAGMDHDNEKVMYCMEKSKGDLIKGGTGCKKVGRRLQKYVAAPVVFTVVAFKALACRMKTPATSQHEVTRTTQISNLNEKSYLHFAF